MTSSEQTPAIIEFITPVTPLAFPTEWYAANSEEHFWFQWRARAANAMIRRVGLPVIDRLKVFDIGCGTGITARQFAHITAWEFDGADLNLEALNRCEGGMKRVLYYDILERRPEFQGRYDVVVLFDVVEHIEHTQPFLDAALYHLRRGGVVLVNVPALGVLFSTYDTAAGHFRRYTLKSLAEEFVPFKTSVVDCRYWGMSMVPLLWLRKQVLREDASETQTIRTGFNPPSRFAHTMLKTLMKTETSVLSKPPLGSSVMAVVRKDG